MHRRCHQVIVAAAVLWSAVPLSSVSSASRSRTRQPDSQNGESSRLSDTRADIIKAVGSVGLILVRNTGDPTNQAPRPRGSAVVVRNDGIVVTNVHVIVPDDSSAPYGELFFSLPDTGMEAQSAQRRYRLKPVLIKPEYDLVLLRIVSAFDGRPVPQGEVLPAIEFGDSRRIQLLDKLIIIGFPQGGGTSVTVNEGVVEGKDIAGNWIKTSARLIHGNSGGAAVDRLGRLIGIPTRVVLDKSLIRKNPGPGRESGAAYEAASVGFLRPAQLVQSMLAKVDVQAGTDGTAKPNIGSRPQAAPAQPSFPQTMGPALIMARGLVRAADDHHPIAGARVGLLPLGVSDVTATNLIAWGGTNADGEFELNKPTPPGRYTIKVRALGYQDFLGAVDIGQESVVVDLRRGGRK